MAAENTIRLLIAGASPAPLTFPMTTCDLHEALAPLAEAADQEARRGASLWGALEEAYGATESYPAIVDQPTTSYVRNYPAVFLAAYVDSFDGQYRVAYRETFWEEFEELVKARVG